MALPTLLVLCVSVLCTVVEVSASDHIQALWPIRKQRRLRLCSFGLVGDVIWHLSVLVARIAPATGERSFLVRSVLTDR